MKKTLSIALLAAMTMGIAGVAQPLEAGWGPAVKKLGRAGGGWGPSNGARRAPGGGGATVDQNKVPSWEKASTEVIESAASEERPIVIYFAGEKENDFTVYGEELREISDNDAIFIKFDFNADREKDPFAEESVVPTNPLLSDNPAREYGVPAGSSGTILVCDWHGNKYFQLKSKSKAKEILAMVGKVSDKVEKEEKSLRKNLEKAQASMDKDDRKNAIKSLLKNFKDGQVGLEAQEESVALYHEIMDAAREELAELTASGDKDALKKLASDMKKTDIEGDVKDAIKGVS